MRLPPRLLLAALGAGMVWACGPTAPSNSDYATDSQARGPAPQMQGDWLVTEAGKPRMVWTVKQSGLALTGTIAVDPRDATMSPAPSGTIKGTLVGVGPTWEARLDAPKGYMTLDGLSFRFCPLAGGEGGCRTGQKRFYFPGITPASGAIVAPVGASTGAASPAPSGVVSSPHPSAASDGATRAASATPFSSP